MSDIAS